MYDLDLSLWRLSIDGALFTFPKNTLLAQGSTRFPGSSLGFASTTISSSTLIKLLFQNMEEVLRISQTSASTTPIHQIQKIQESTQIPQNIQIKKVVQAQSKPQKNVASTMSSVSSSINSGVKVASSTMVKNTKKDTRIVMWLKSLFNL
jgi:hypothetical protein